MVAPNKSLLAAFAIACSTSSFAQPAPVASAAMYSGECQRYEISKENGIVKGVCGPKVSVLNFADGYTSIQFQLTVINGKNDQVTAFVGPRWVNFDNELYATMVLEQVVESKVSENKMTPTNRSGMCQYLRKAKDDPPNEPTRIFCTYNAGRSSFLYILNKVTKDR